MSETNETLKISHEDHFEAIVQRVYGGWDTSQVVDSWMEKYPRWAHLGRKVFRDAARVSNPQSKKFSTRYRKIYERTIAHYREERRELLEATVSTASSAISAIVEAVRSNVGNVPVENAHDLLHLSRAINPLKDITHKTIQEINHEHSNSHARNTNRDEVDRLLRYKDLADELAEDEG